eukprot:CAMPEP_0198229666 /NCGR_PEP_ID=MMETSP1445-20131203/114241_1 /TAXON_ID=36898 /ORGANISM="Pyramimonas sp., Strain CCMP2087" /LENGTH=496 /DNA_ID=CAMNT_0043910135 /DNA_START=715 /DNA_END=2206 /DNA_ORIENTATION=+
MIVATMSKETADKVEARQTILRDAAISKAILEVRAGGGRGGQFSNEVTEVLKDDFKKDSQCSEERAALMSAAISLEPAKTVPYIDDLLKREQTAARKRKQTLHTAAERDQRCGQLWTHIPAFLLAQVMDQLSAGAQYPSVTFRVCGWQPAVSAVMRRVCKSWQEMHDRLLSIMSVKMTTRTSHGSTIDGCSIPDGYVRLVWVAASSVSSNEESVQKLEEMHDRLLSIMSVKMTTTGNRHSNIPCELSGWRKFTGLKALHIHTSCERREQLVALASLTGLTTLSLNVSDAYSAKCLSALAPLTALSTLQLNGQAWHAYLSGSLLRELAPLNSLTSLNFGNSLASDDSLRALAPLTGLTSLHLFRCDGGCVTAEGLKALAPLTGLTNLDLFKWCSKDAVTDESLGATLAPLKGLTRLNLGGCEIGSLTKQGLAAAVAPLTCLTTLLPPAREVVRTESDEDDDGRSNDSYDDYEEDEFRDNSSSHSSPNMYYDEYGLCI